MFKAVVGVIIPLRIAGFPFISFHFRLLRIRQTLLNTILRKDFELALKFVIFIGLYD